MLVLTRSAGESLLIGKSVLVVRRLAPSVALVVSRPGLVNEFEFSLQDIAGQPVIQLEEGLVKLMQVQRTEITLAIDAPRDVPILRGELRPRSPRTGSD